MPASIHRFIILTALSLLLLPVAKAQSFTWAQAISAANPPYKTAVVAGTTDTAGNLYTVGEFGGTANFAGMSLTAVSNLDMFVMKQDPLGNLIWVKQVRGLSIGVYGCYGRAIDVDNAGNVFVTGFFRDSFDFDPGPAIYTLNSFGSYHAFILKLDPEGNFLWVKDIGTQVPAVGIQATAAGRDKNGYLYFAALVNGDGITPIDVDPGPGVYNITPVISDLLLEKLDSNGNFIWAKLITGDNAKQPLSVAFDSASNVFVSGKFLGSADFDPSPGVYTLTAVPGSSLPNEFDIFVAKYDSAGNFGWAHSFGSSSDDEVRGGTVDRFGNVLVTGSFGGTIDFDPGPNTYPLTAASSRSLFTLKLKNNGEFAWVRMGGASAGSYYGGSVTADSAGNVYTAMFINGLCDLDPGPGVYNAYSGTGIQKLDSAGNFVWGAGIETNTPTWIGLDKYDSVYVTGVFTGSKDFDPGPERYLLSATPGYFGYILKLNQTPLPPTGIKDTSFQTTLSVYPNPSPGVVTFSSPAVIERIELTDLTGKLVYIAEPGAAKTVINLGGKAAGVYYYKVDCGGTEQRGRLVLY